MAMIKVPTCRMHYTRQEYASKFLSNFHLAGDQSGLNNWAKISVSNTLNFQQIDQNNDDDDDDDDDDDENNLFNDEDEVKTNSIDQTSFIQKQSQAPKLPDYVNWHDVVKLPVRNQICGDCWANAGTSALEALYQIIGNQYQQFSVQNYIDCAGPPPNQNGCNGGNSANVFNYTQKYGAVAYNNNPYIGDYNSANKCSKSSYQKQNVYFVTGQGKVTDNCYQIKAAVNVQPIVVYVYVDNSFDQSGSSIIQDAPGVGNHAVLLIGYTPTYWVIQNSWGTASQYNGFCRIAMGNTRKVCVNGFWPVSSAIYKLTPQTAPFNFIYALTAVPLSSIVYAPVSISALIGTNCPKNLAGNYYTLAFQFVTTLTRAFNIYFDNGPVGNKNGYLQSTNLVNGQTFLLGYCGSYNTQANDEGVLQTMYPQTPNATKYLIIFNPKNTDYFGVSWYSTGN